MMHIYLSLYIQHSILRLLSQRTLKEFTLNICSVNYLSALNLNYISYYLSIYLFEYAPIFNYLSF